MKNLQAQSKTNDDLSVVCFGASAGGFEAYCTILSLLPADTGLAFIIVHHQPADGKSLLVEILPRFTKMPVVLLADGEIVKADHVYVVPAGMQVTMAGDAFRISPLSERTGWPKNITIFLLSLADGELVKADHVYVVPAGMQVTMAGDAFRISPLSERTGWPKNISIFLQSLAADRQKRAVAVILSGFDSDGAAALKPIKDAGGIVIAQSFQTAQQPDMPQSAVKTGCVDFLLSPAEIADEIRRIGEERGRSKD